MSDWIKSKLPVNVTAGWVAKNLNPGKIIIDVRKNAQEHIKGAVSMDSSKIAALGKKYATKKRGKKVGEVYSKRNLPGIPDKKAPIIIYGETHKVIYFPLVYLFIYTFLHL